MKSLAEVLSFLMTKVGIKAAELARKTGIAQPVISRLMSGVTNNPQILTIKPIADFFQVTLDQLLGISPLDIENTNFTIPSTNLSNKFNSIKMIAIVLTNNLPILIRGYQKSVQSDLVKEEIPIDLLPLLDLNVKNLLEIIDHIQGFLMTENNKY